MTGWPSDPNNAKEREPRALAFGMQLGSNLKGSMPRYLTGLLNPKQVTAFGQLSLIGLCDVILDQQASPGSGPYMSNPNIPESPTTAESGESFGSILSQFERSHTTKPAEGLREGTVVSVSSDSAFVDLGFKTEGVLPLSEFQNDRAAMKPGDTLQVTIKGRDPGGYYLLTRNKAARPNDWTALETAFADKTTIVGTVTGVVKGGLSVDVGVSAFMPGSRSGVRDAAAMGYLVEQVTGCRII